MQSTEAILSSRCASSTVTMLNKMIRALRCTRENRALVALRRAVGCPKPCETSSIWQNHPRRRPKSRTAAAITALSSTRRRTARRMEIQRIITNSRHRVQRRPKVIQTRLPRRSPSCACFYDRSSTARITFRRSEPSLLIKSVVRSTKRRSAVHYGGSAWDVASWEQSSREEGWWHSWLRAERPWRNIRTTPRYQ